MSFYRNVCEMIANILAIIFLLKGRASYCIILVADVIDVDKIISKRISYFVCRSLENCNSFSKLYTCEMGVSVLACTKEKCRNRWGSNIQYV